MTPVGPAARRGGASPLGAQDPRVGAGRGPHEDRRLASRARQLLRSSGYPSCFLLLLLLLKTDMAPFLFFFFFSIILGGWEKDKNQDLFVYILVSVY